MQPESSRIDRIVCPTKTSNFERPQTCTFDQITAEKTSQAEAEAELHFCPVKVFDNREFERPERCHFRSKACLILVDPIGFTCFLKAVRDHNQPVCLSETSAVLCLQHFLEQLWPEGNTKGIAISTQQCHLPQLGELLLHSVNPAR